MCSGNFDVMQHDGEKMSGHPVVIRRQGEVRGRAVAKYYLISL